MLAYTGTAAAATTVACCVASADKKALRWDVSLVSVRTALVVWMITTRASVVTLFKGSDRLLTTIYIDL